MQNQPGDFVRPAVVRPCVVRPCPVWPVSRRDGRCALALVPVPRRRGGGAVTDPTRFDRLSPRHRECLKGVRDLKGSKEIADALGIEKTTVDGYLTEAVKILGARNRRDAALQWSQHEQEHANLSICSETITLLEPTPDKMGGDFMRLAPAAAHLPSVATPDEMIVGAAGRTAATPSRPPPSGIRLPFRRKGQRGNDLSVGDRLIWIQVITLGIAIGFGMLMTGLQVLTGLIEAVTRHLS